MTEKRIQFNTIIQNQLPAYVREEFPLVAEFLKQYYISQEFQSSPTDLIQNIDQYLKLDNIKSNSDSTTLTEDITFLDETILVKSTTGFPNSYGLLQIDDEIITYTGKTQTSFTGCIRGFSGVSSYSTQNKPDELTFNSSESADHSKSDNDGEPKQVINLSSLFLKEFFNKIKYQLTPGFEQREFYSGLDKYLFLKQSKDFYSTRGTDLSFKILFKVLYGEDVKIVKPQDYLIKPSDAQYNITNNLVVESVSGDPYELINSTLFQDEYGEILSGYSQISNVEEIFTDTEKKYYKLSFDAGYNKDIRVDGALYGNFSIHPKTKLIGEVLSGSETLDVDSTVGFPLSGSLSIVYSDGTEGIITYSSKSLNQFFGCQSISNTILDGTDIWINSYAYGQSNTNSGQTIKVRITAVLKDIDIIDDSYFQEKGSSGIIKTLGVSAKDIISNNWFFNISSNIEVSSIKIIDNIDNIYQVSTKVNHKLRVGDSIKIISNDSLEKNSTVINIITDTDIQISGQGVLELNKFYTIQRNILKVNSDKHYFLSNQLSNVQNVYKDGENTLISSPSIPYYNNQPLNVSDRSITFSGTFVGDTFRIVDHGLYTGDAIYYTSKIGSLFDDGLYFVKKIDSNNLKFSKSRANIYNSIFINLENSVTVVDSKIEDYDFYNKNLESQKLLRQISPPLNDGKEYLTNPGPVGILINGVEILNYKSKDKIYYGPIEDISVVNSGSNYDIINPPTLIISDSVGAGATGYCSVKGSLQSIRIVDSGFDYLEPPQINITGGNGIGAKANPVMKLIDHKVFFNSEQKSSFVDLSNNSIGFSTYHKFRDVEKVIYKTEGQRSVGGISTNSSYYVSVQDPYKIKLHKTFDEAISGINTISLTSYGIGNHILESYNKKSVIASINIEDFGQDYENKKRTAKIDSINIYLSEIEIKNHDFKSGEIINYSTNGSSIGGLSNNQNYYITVIDDNRFKLSLVGTDPNSKDYYYQTKQYIDFTSTGTGTHVFNYPQILVEIVGKVGISSTNGNSFDAKIQPIFRGEISSVHLENNGVGYGSSEVLNFVRDPVITLNSGSESNLVPIINDGKIVDVLVINSGKDYNSPPNLNIITSGKGRGCVLTPILENNQIKSVKIVESGAGYDKNSTFISVTPAGSRAQFKAKLKSWTINLFAKYFNKISSDDGFIFYNPSSKYGLQFTHLYAPRKLRENVYSQEYGGKILYGKPDLKKINGFEVSSTDHSPIVGWSYDGNPIYGPYGYSKKDGNGSVSLMKSGYILNLLDNRPPFPEGFFVEDYEYQNANDETVLDEYNGRFCVTPDFPNGTYAYFCSIDNSSSNIFDGYRLPVFPYVIGNRYKSIPNDFNFKRSSNQDDYNLNESNWIRNTTPYNFTEGNEKYSYISLPNGLNQTVEIKYASPGSIENIGIITGGNNYSVNDTIIFDDQGTDGFGFSSRVSKIGGKSINNISVASTIIYNVDIYADENKKNSFIVQSDSPHNFLNLDEVTILGLNTTSSFIKGFYKIKTIPNTLSISNPSGIGSVGITGIATYISVSGNLLYSNVRENDIFSLGNEKIKILNVEKESSRIRVLRSVDGTVGSSHSYSDVLYEIPRRFFIDQSDFVSYTQKTNKEIYFNPKESLGIGTIYGVGIGTLISFSNPGVGITQIFIPTRSIYLPNHNLETGDSLTYSTNGGNEISVSSDGNISTGLLDQSIVYVAKISNDLIGISTVKVGLGSTGTFVGIASTTNSIGILYFTGIGTNTYHSFTTNYPKLTGKVYQNKVIVSTKNSHQLSNGDSVFVNVNPGISTTIIVKYDDVNRRLLIDPKSFSSGDVNTTENTILITNHNFNAGQKVIHTSLSPSGGLLNNQIYYVVVFDRNTIKLCSSYYDAISPTPEIVNITSASNGIISPINPPIKVYRDSLVNFDLSDSSLSYGNGSEKYPAFDFNFYIDSNYTEIFNSSKTNNNFEVEKYGVVGVDSNAKVSLKVNKNTPLKLYYKLDKVYTTGLILPKEKEESVNDYSVISNNEIQVNNSILNGEYKIISTGASTFTYNIVDVPESYSYNSNTSSLYYETTSLSGLGPITEIEITSRGQNYYTVPDFVEVLSNNGTGAILEAFSTSIGKIKRTKINDIGFNFPSDFTLKPNLSLPQILKVEPLNSFQSIGITSVGRGYVTSPKLVVFDGKTKNILSEVDLKYSLGDTQVTILNNTYRLNDIDPIIIPTQNSNGVGISSIYFNSFNKNVVVTLSVGFSTSNSFPFSIGDKVLIENISVGIETTGKGYNSSNYNYQLFTVIDIDENLGGEGGTVTYNIGEFLSGDEFPGTYDPENSSGRIIPEKYFPKFKSTLKPNNFIENEKVRYFGQPSLIGTVQNWNDKIKYLNVLSKEDLQTGNIIEGLSSRTQGEISSVINSKSFINVGSYSKTENGWITETGILNNQLQKIQDNFYYQNFSYSLKSKVSYDTWENVVGSLNHTAGFKKFSDYQLESYANSGIGTDVISNVDVTVDIDGYASLNCVYDFDLASENTLNIESKVVSDEITFSSRILTDYFESVGNRVLTIDDFSGLFNSNPRFERYSIVHRFALTDARAQKYITYVKDRRYSSQRQLMILTLLHDNNKGYINQYGRVESYYDLGSFDFKVEGSDGVILFYPTKYKVNDYDVTVLSYNLKDNFSGIGSTNIGGIVDIKTNTVFASSSPTTIVGIGSTYTSAKVLVAMGDTNGQYQFDELNVVHNGTNVEFISYGQLSNHSIDSYSSSGFGTYSAYLTESDLNIDFTPNTGIAVTVSVIQVAIANTFYSGIGTFNMNYMKFEASSTSIGASTIPTENIVAEYSDNYDGGYFIVQISDITNNRHQLSEVVVVNDTNSAYLTEYATLETYSEIGTIGVGKTSNKTQLTFTPLPNIDVQVKVCFNSLGNII